MSNHSANHVQQRVEASVIIDRDKCIGCDICVQVCPMGILALDKDGKAYMKYDECWYCTPCQTDCPVDAVTVNIPYLVR
ncbi:ferredoxin family protein [Paenibacillus sp. sptzw28]|jgi:NAD-dependent dihydropyrimidine dehydrogenase PreA subunit|uniref:4Fe-4S dicluster domain-containing protein n=1 Tax=Paenibacillus sp. sptzw28 TaxID=715179 RepID=UPI001C6EA096|nr:ferredoxin family protein [Paenibacillus sp. sptzw28]QYR21352.1 ferredoxin family protein [Paenibacillus sp. sptzw28]